MIKNVDRLERALVSTGKVEVVSSTQDDDGLSVLYRVITDEANWLPTLAGVVAVSERDGGGAFIGNDKYGYAQIVATDIDAANGVIHVLDAVILPPSLDL